MRHVVNKYSENAVGFVDICFKMIDGVDTDKMARIITTLWTLWWRRNQICWNDKIPTIFEVIRRARDTHQEWLNVQRRNMNTNNRRAT
jgi:hypothetical protein